MKYIALVISGIVLAVAISALLAYPVMLLWNNCLVGAINGINQIGFLQAWGIMLLCGFLFKSNVSSKE